MQQTSDEDLVRQKIGVVMMGRSVPVKRSVLTKKLAVRRYLADSGLMEVVTPYTWKWTLKHGMVLVEALATGILQKRVRFDLVRHDIYAFFNIIAKEKRDQAVIEANHAKRWESVKLRDAGSMMLRRLSSS